MAETDSIRSCAHCGGQVFPRINKTTGQPSKAERRFCSSRCIYAAAQARRPKRVWERTTRAATCANCGVAFASVASTGSPGGWTCCCSNRCGAMLRRANDGTTKAKMLRLARVTFTTRRGHCLTCGKAITKIGSREFCDENCRASLYVWKPADRECRECKAPFRQGRRWQMHCSTECETSSLKRMQRTNKLRRKVRTKGLLAESIDPLLVFERDRWICHLCGVKTDQKLRGFPVPLAPELDHIVSLAEGGSHTWGNVACACRACNGAKGARSKGQLGLGFAVVR